MAGSWSAALRKRAQARRQRARLPQLQRGPQLLQGIPGGNRQEAPVRTSSRKYLRPDRLLRSEPELQLAGVWHRQHSVQHDAIGAAGVQIRLLVLSALLLFAFGLAPRAEIAGIDPAEAVRQGVQKTVDGSAALQQAAALVQQGKLAEA